MKPIMHFFLIGFIISNTLKNNIWINKWKLIKQLSIQLFNYKSLLDMYWLKIEINFWYRIHYFLIRIKSGYNQRSWSISQTQNFFATSWCHDVKPVLYRCTGFHYHWWRSQRKKQSTRTNPNSTFETTSRLFREYMSRYHNQNSTLGPRRGSLLRLRVVV